MSLNARRLAIAAAAIAVALIMARVVFHYAAEITIKTSFYDALGMGGAYATRWQTSVVLALVGVVGAVILSLPMLYLLRRPAGDAASKEAPLIPDNPDDINWDAPVPEPEQPNTPGVTPDTLRQGLRIGWLVTLALLIGILAPGLAQMRDDLLAAFNSTAFGVDDPIFGRDVSFFVFIEPAISGLVGLLTGALALATIASVAAGIALWVTERRVGSWLESRVILERTQTVGFALGGLFLLGLSISLWMSRYQMTIGGDDVIAGAGAAARDIDIPTRAVGALLLALLSIAIIALAVPRLRRRFEKLPIRETALAATAVWGVAALAMVIFATPWWVVLLVPIGAAGVILYRSTAPQLTHLTPAWSLPAFAAATGIIVSALGPAGAALNDAVVLRGSKLQVEQENIAATLEATRRATGIDQAEKTDAPYRRNGVTRAAILETPASVSSLRFLDTGPTLEACSRLQVVNLSYTCNDVDVDRYTIDGERRTVFVMGREIDYTRAQDFQRRHFTFTHGFGLIAAPVNEIDESGRPRWIAGSIPQRGQLQIDQPRIYFGAQRDMDWAMVNTTQPVFDGKRESVQLEWTGDTGVTVGSGWNRLAMTEFLGGLPFIGGGREVWNATSGRPANSESELLLFRDVSARVNELAPFLTVDRDPYFAAADGELWVIANAYTETDRYPYGADFGGINYRRQSVVAVMNAFTGETKLYALGGDPIIETWRKVYSELFTDFEEMPDSIKAHLRYGEALFDLQARALERFHVENADVFFSGDQAWAITEESSGAGEEGSRVLSPARYTFAVLPGAQDERFLAIRAFKPSVPGRGIGFTGWLAVSNEPADFGRLTLLEFPVGGQDPLVAIDTFTSNVSRDRELSAELGVRGERTLRGNTIVVPIGEGVLYVQPLYLDSPQGDSLPLLWQVVVSFGDDEVHVASSFEQALVQALRARGAGSDRSEGPSATTGDETVDELVRRAASEFRAYRQAFGSGDFDEAARRLEAFQQALDAAERASGGSPPAGDADSSPAPNPEPNGDAPPDGGQSAPAPAPTDG
jgi:uncharacterized membrane protein (UPF0182 family)